MQKMYPLCRDVRFKEIFYKVIRPQSEPVRSSLYCPSYGGVRFIVCPLYRDSTVTRNSIIFHIHIITENYILSTGRFSSGQLVSYRLLWLEHTKIT